MTTPDRYDCDDARHRRSNQLRQTLRSADSCPSPEIAPSRHSHRRARCHGIAPKHYQRGHGASVGFAVDPINAIANGPVDEEGDT